MTHPLQPESFRPDAIAPDTAALNDTLVGLMTGLPEWWNVGAETARQGRRQGRGPFPAPVFSPRARTIAITGRDGNEIPLRIIAPDQPRGVYLHIHGGGWVLGGADLQDPMLEHIADATRLAVVSVEYRLAPEHPYPAGPDDCESAAAWLVQNARAESDRTASPSVASRPAVISPPSRCCACATATATPAFAAPVLSMARSTSA